VPVSSEVLDATVIDAGAVTGSSVPHPAMVAAAARDAIPNAHRRPVRAPRARPRTIDLWNRIVPPFRTPRTVVQASEQRG
jgi:hypothetical protein